MYVAVVYVLSTTLIPCIRCGTGMSSTSNGEEVAAKPTSRMVEEMAVAYA